MVFITRDRRERIDGAFEREVRYILRHAFTNSDFFTLAETAKYKPSESYDTWQQMREERPEIVEIYHKGEWICDVHTGMTRDQMVQKVHMILSLKAEAKRKEDEKNANTDTTTSGRILKA